MTNRQIIEDFIRDDEDFVEDEDVGCYCDYCGRPIYTDDNCLGLISEDRTLHPNMRKIMLCDRCVNNQWDRMSLKEVLEMAGVYCTEGEFYRTKRHVDSVMDHERNGQRKI